MPSTTNVTTSHHSAIQPKPSAIEQYKVPIIASIALIFAGVGVFQLWSWNRARTETAARDEFYPVRKSIESARQKLVAAVKVEPAPVLSAEDAKDPKKSEAARAKADEAARSAAAVLFQPVQISSTYGDSLDRLIEISKKYPNTSAGFEAALLAGSVFMRHGDANNAVLAYESAASMKRDLVDATSVKLSLALALEAAGKIESAVDQLAKIIPKKGAADETLAPLLLTNLAALQSKLGKTTDATTTLKRLRDDYPNSPEAQSASVGE